MWLKFEPFTLLSYSQKRLYMDSLIPTSLSALSDNNYLLRALFSSSLHALQAYDEGASWPCSACRELDNKALRR